MKRTAEGMKWLVGVWIDTLMVWNDNCRYEMTCFGMKWYQGMITYHMVWISIERVWNGLPRVWKDLWGYELIQALGRERRRGRRWWSSFYCSYRFPSGVVKPSTAITTFVFNAPLQNVGFLILQRWVFNFGTLGFLFVFFNPGCSEPSR